MNETIYSSCFDDHRVIKIFQYLTNINHLEEPEYLWYFIPFDLLRAPHADQDEEWRKDLVKKIQTQLFWMDKKTGMKILSDPKWSCGFMPFPIIEVSLEGIRVELGRSFKKLLVLMQKEKKTYLLLKTGDSKAIDYIKMPSKMNIPKTSIHDFINDGPYKDEGKTVKINCTQHNFFKEVSTFYDMRMTDLIGNILENWMQDHKDEFLNERFNRIKKRGF